MAARKILVQGLLAAGMFVWTSVALAAEEPSHDHGHGEAGTLQLHDGARWGTDAPLQAGMTAIREDMATALSEIHRNELPGEGYVDLAERIETHLTGIIENCKLTPEADAQFHVLLARLYGGVAAMKQGADDSRAGAVQVVRALEAYPDYFEHPGWQPLAH